jgi:toxin ParE1/3/4
VLRWSERARLDLKEIHDRIRQDSPGNAKALVREFLARAEQLPTLPRAGRVVPELSDPDIREVPVHSWRLIYQLRGEHLFVLALIHKRRLPASDQLRG